MINNTKKRESNTGQIKNNTVNIINKTKRLKTDNSEIKETTIEKLPSKVLARIVRLSGNKNTCYVSKTFSKAFDLSCLGFLEINSRNIEIFANEKLVGWKNRVDINQLLTISSLVVEKLENFWFIYDILLKFSYNKNVYNEKVQTHEKIQTKLHEEVIIQSVDLQGADFDDQLKLINDFIELIPRLECFKIKLSDIQTASRISKPTKTYDNFEIHVSATLKIESVNSENDDDKLNLLLVDIQSLPKHIKVVNLDISELVYNTEKDQRVIEEIIEACPHLRTLTFSSCALALEPAIAKIAKYLRIEIYDEDESGWAYAWLNKLSEEKPLNIHIHLSIKQKIDDNTIDLYNSLFNHFPDIESVEMDMIETSKNLMLPKNLKQISCEHVTIGTELKLANLASLEKIEIDYLAGSLVVSESTKYEIKALAETGETVISGGESSSPSDPSSSDEN